MLMMKNQLTLLMLLKSQMMISWWAVSFWIDWRQGVLLVAYYIELSFTVIRSLLSSSQNYHNWQRIKSAAFICPPVSLLSGPVPFPDVCLPCPPALGDPWRWVSLNIF